MTPWNEGMGPMPALYLGHGAPPLLDDAVWTAQLRDWASALPRPRAILIVSAHWEAAPLSLSAAGAATPLVYDFGGFDARFHAMTYPTPDAADLAGLVASVLPDSEPLHQHGSRGLDHGAWVPMKVMYPDATIPALQLSLPSGDPLRLLALGRRLRPLREQGVLVVGSGFMTHGLPYIRDWSPTAAPPGWSVDFDLWAAETLESGDVDALADFGRTAPGMPYAHPSVEHFLPLFVTLGTAANPSAPPRTPIEGYFFGLSKRSVEVD